MRLDTLTNSNMQNSMVMLVRLVLEEKKLFWANLAQKIKRSVSCESWQLDWFEYAELDGNIQLFCV